MILISEHALNNIFHFTFSLKYSKSWKKQPWYLIETNLKVMNLWKVKWTEIVRFAEINITEEPLVPGAQQGYVIILGWNIKIPPLRSP